MMEKEGILVTSKRTDIWAVQVVHYKILKIADHGSMVDLCVYQDSFPAEGSKYLQEVESFSTWHKTAVEASWCAVAGS